MITIRSAVGYPQDSKFSTDADVRKVVSIWNRMHIRICDLKHFVRYFEDSGCETNFWSVLIFWRKLHIAQSFFYYLRKHIFVFLFHSESDTRLDSFPIRTVRLNRNKNRIRMPFYKTWIGLGSEKPLSNHLWHLLARLGVTNLFETESYFLCTD